MVGQSRSVYALDFDGILCDSCGESSIAALKAAKVVWPNIVKDIPLELEEQVLAQMRTVRPVVETGYENVLLVRLLLEMSGALHDTPTSAVAKGLSIEDILKGWEKDLKPRAMAEWGAHKDELVQLFGNIRDHWMAEDLASWIAANRFYPGTPDALKFSSSTLYIVTTKQTRFVQALLKELAGIEFPEDHIYGLGTGPKVEVLQKLQSLQHHRDCSFHFVEDRLATLRNVIKTPALDNWNLYLGVWGYNTDEERAEASTIPRITMLDIPTFCNNLK